MKSLRFLLLLIIALPLLFSCDPITEVDTVETPVISPNGGLYTSSQNVTITCGTDGATIKYTTDGTEPDSSATAMTYTDPIVVNTNKTIKAIAIKDDWNDSDIATAVFTVYDKMVSIPAGTFTMGRTTGTGDPDELPAHSVNISKAFYIGKYEVTQAEWAAVMGSTPSNFAGDNRPVEQINFYSTLVYCNKRSIAEGLTPVYTISGSTNPTVWGAIPTTNTASWNAAICNWNANGYRLPSEAEWEYAARNASNTPDYLYSGSDTIGDVAWYETNSNAMTHDVGLKNPTVKGTYDMTGNVQEWVWDWFSLDYYATSPSIDPYGPATGTVHVMRGGSWDQNASQCRIAFRNWGSPEKGEDRVSNSRLGFRVVRTAE